MKISPLAFLLSLLLTVGTMAQEPSAPAPPDNPSATASRASSGRVAFEYVTVIDYYTTEKNKSHLYLNYSDGRSVDASTKKQSAVMGELGAEGWELVNVSITLDTHPNYYRERSYLYFKRAKQ